MTTLYTPEQVTKAVADLNRQICCLRDVVNTLTTTTTSTSTTSTSTTTTSSTTTTTTIP